MRWRQIEAFRATMLSGTITGAAKQLAISQPSASRLIADLEFSLKFSLFERVKGRLSPTPEAMRFYQEVESSFVGMDQLERAAAQIREERTGHLSALVTPSLSVTLLPAALKRFYKKWPSVMVTVDVRSAGILSSLQMQSTDIAISPKLPDFPGIEQELLAAVDLICALPPGHRLTTHDQIEPKDLDGEDYIGLSPEGSFNWSKIDKVLERTGVSVKTRVTTQASQTLYSMVAAGLGLALVEPFAAATWMRHGVVVKPFRPRIPAAFTISYPGERVRSQLTKDLSAAVRHELELNPPVHNG